METLIEQSLSQKIIRNTIFNIIGRFWGILVTIFLTPYIIHHIGIERFGIWALIGVFTGYFGLLDFGVGSSFVKYIAEFYTKKDYDRINQIVNTGFIFYSLFAIVIVTLAWFLINPLLTFFKISPHLYNEASFVFLLGIILFAISNSLNVFSAIQAGLQRMDISNKVGIVVSLPMIIGTIFFLEAGYGLPGLMVNNAIILVISSVTNIIIAFKILPELKFNLFSFSKEAFKKLFGFGYKLQTSKIASLLHFQMDKILLAYFLNIGFVAYYTVAAQIVSKVRQIPLMLISAILPAASELEAKTDKESLYALYFRSTKYVVLIGLPVSLLIILLANPFIDLWLGKGFEKSVLTLQILMIGYFFNIMIGPGFFILNGIGKPQYGMRSSILAAILNLALSILLVIKIGYFGVVIGTLTAMIIAASYFISMFHQVMNIPFWKTSLKIFPKPLIACFISFSIIHVLIKRIGQIGWFGLIGAGFSYLVLFSLIILVMNYLDDFDKSLINKYSPARLFKIEQVGQR
jgi:O-antigen/teichoic acid export membrane protein